MRSVLTVLLSLTLIGSAQAAETVDVREWEVPWEDTRPRDPYVGPEGDVWFVGQKDDYVGRLNPESGEFERFDLPDGTGPHNLIVDDAGTVWVAGNRDAYIGRLDPETGDIERIAMPEGVSDPHTMIFAPQNRILFTAQMSNFVGRLDRESETVDVREVPTARARPYGIRRGGDRAWVAELGTNKLLEMDPDTLALTEHVLPNEDSRPRRIGIGRDGAVYYTDFARGYLGRFDPETGAMDEWASPHEERARPYGMAVDHRGRVWYVEVGVQPNRIVGFDPESEENAFVTEIPSGGGAVRHMFFDEERRVVWFGADTNTIGRFEVPD